jgi:hypothetical protein
MEAKTMAERLSWGKNHSCGAEYDVLILDRREVADVMCVPAGWATRNYFLKFEEPGAHVVCESKNEAMRHAEKWFLERARAPWE